MEDKVFSSIGKQVLSTIRSPPGVGVAMSTRDQSNRTALFVSQEDRPAVGPKPTFHIDLPAGRVLKNMRTLLTDPHILLSLLYHYLLYIIIILNHFYLSQIVL